MVVHIDKLIRHLKSQIETAEQMRSEFVYITRREAEGCLELAEAQEVIQEIYADSTQIIRCRDCEHGKPKTDGFGNPEVFCFRHQQAHRKPEWFCADGKKGKNDA